VEVGEGCETEGGAVVVRGGVEGGVDWMGLVLGEHDGGVLPSILLNTHQFHICPNKTFTERLPNQSKDKFPLKPPITLTNPQQLPNNILHTDPLTDFAHFHNTANSSNNFLPPYSIIQTMKHIVKDAAQHLT
jgi:hypothetical protein